MNRITRAKFLIPDDDWKLVQAKKLLGQLEETKGEMADVLPTVVKLLDVHAENYQVKQALNLIQEYVGSDKFSAMMLEAAKIDWKFDFEIFEATDVEPEKFSTKFQADLGSFLAWYPLVDEQTAREIVSSIGEMGKNVFEAAFPDYEVIFNATEHPIIWYVIGGMTNYAAARQVMDRGTQITKELTKTLSRKFARVTKKKQKLPK